MNDDEMQDALDAQGWEQQKRLQELEEEELWLRSPPDPSFDIPEENDQ